MEASASEPQASQPSRPGERRGGLSELEAALAINRALSGKLALDRVLGVAVGVVAEVIGAEGSSILLIDPDTGGMAFQVVAGPGAEAQIQRDVGEEFVLALLVHGL